mmetsp:Transcript_39767/g.119560  ORF Transcript_39767/g.119560 Transcript_39767/m.119560 type:complete len:1121 (+) Transcript_39767:451-3813(+)
MRSGKFLRPPPGGGQGAMFDSSGSSDSEDDEEEQTPQPPSRKSANLSSDEEDDDEAEADDDDDEDYDDAPASKKRKGGGSGGGETKKAKKINTRAFFDMEAEADDDDEDADEPYGTHHDPDDIVRRHYTEEDIRKEQLDEEAEELIRQQDRRRAQAGGGMFTSDMSAADVAREIEERHRMQRRTVSTSAMGDEGGEGEGFGPGYGAVAQQSLVPSVSDPSMWMFSCAPGKEQELVYQIMNKSIAFARQGKPLGITGAVAAQSKGRIYVESYSEPAVIEAMQGIRNLMQYSMRLVPISDMTTVMTVVPKKKPVKKNDWVRMSRGHFKGDLALVRAVRDSGLKCIIQCVPRIDLTLSDLPPDEARIRRRTVRPPQKFFNPQEIAALGKHTLRQRFPGLGDIYCDYFEGNYYHDGYLLKEVTVGTMVKPTGEDDPPTLDELQTFRMRKKADQGYDDEGEENEGSKMAASLLDELSELQTGISSKSSGGGLIIGDTVEVVEGDLVGMRGKLMSIDGTTVKVKPTNASDLGDTAEVEFLASQVRKHIAVGNHVKVTDGRYANETGVVVAVEQLEGDTDPTAVVLTDMTNKEISVRTSQLQESAEVASGQDKLAGYELHDLVVLSGGGSANEVGVIVRVGREDFTVVNNHGIVREIRPEELRGKRNASSNRAVALDVQGNQIRVGDTVGVAEGPHKGKTATIKRMSRAQLFLYSQTRTENAGIFVVRSRSCVLAGSSAQNRSQPGDGGVSPFSTPQSQGGKGGPPGARGRKEDGLIGKTVRIQAGQWKGYLGAVSDATPTHVQVELHSRLKKVMVVRERVAVVGDKFGSTEDPNRDNASTGSSMLAPSTPFLGGATPMHGGATPMHGGATPMHDGMGGGFTPSHPTTNDDVWRPGGAIDRTPMHDGSDEVDGSGGDSGGGWGSSDGAGGGAQQSSDPFSGASSSGADGSGWGSSSADQGGGATWVPSTGEENHSSNGGSGGDTGGNASGHDMGTSSATQMSRGGSALDTGAAMGDGDGGEEAAVWFMERVCVQLKKDDAPAVIKEIGSNNTAVVELEDKSTVTVRAGEVSMVPPKEKDMVLVTGGADVGVEGELVCIDGTDAILKDSNEDFKIVDFVHLAKIVGDT